MKKLLFHMVLPCSVPYVDVLASLATGRGSTFVPGSTLLELGAPRSGFRVLSEYITRRGDAYTARTGLPFPRPIPTRDQFDATWKSLTAPLALSPPVECAEPPSSGHRWPLRSWAQYVQYRPPLCHSIDWSRPLTFVVRGDGYPCAGGSWSQLSVGLLNHGLKARTPAFLCVIGMAVTGDKDMVALGQIWAQVLQVCSLHFRVVHNSRVHNSRTAVIKRRAAHL